MVVYVNFCLFPLYQLTPPPPPPKHVHLFTISVKNQARPTRKIVGSYSQVFTVSVIKFLIFFVSDHFNKLKSVPLILVEFCNHRTMQPPHENYFNICQQHKLLLIFQKNCSNCIIRPLKLTLLSFTSANQWSAVAMVTSITS